MALRLIEAHLPAGANEELDALVEALGPVDAWSTGGEGGVLARILIDAEETESATDRLAERFGGGEGFRVVVHAVEATLPRVEQDEEGPDEKPVGFWSRPGRISREELYADLSEGSRLHPLFLVAVALSTIVAAVGLMRSDVAVIIGAMVIAPLLGPNMGLALAATLGDRDLAARAFRAGMAGLVLALVLSSAIGAVFHVDPASTELAVRTRIGFADVAVALAAGAAGSLAYTSALPSAVIGVMVAVALVPPLVATGLFVGSGHPSMAFRSGLLVVTNVTCVNLAGVAMFLAQKVRPRTWWDAERARRATRLAIASWLFALGLLAAAILLARR